MVDVMPFVSTYIILQGICQHSNIFQLIPVTWTQGISFYLLCTQFIKCLQVCKSTSSICFRISKIILHIIIEKSMVDVMPFVSTYIILQGICQHSNIFQLIPVTWTQGISFYLLCTQFIKCLQVCRSTSSICLVFMIGHRAVKPARIIQILFKGLFIEEENSFT